MYTSIVYLAPQSVQNAALQQHLAVTCIINKEEQRKSERVKQHYIVL